MVKVTKTNLDGLLILEPRLFKDNRGAFYESWKEADYKEAGIQEKFIQDNVSISKKNVLRGLHYQKDQGQLVTVTHGKIFDVAVDIRPKSKTYKKYFYVELSGDTPRQLYMPPGFAHGFCVLSDLAIINYKCTQYYDPENEGGVIWNDPGIGIEWPTCDWILGERDAVFDKLDGGLC